MSDLQSTARKAGAAVNYVLGKHGEPGDAYVLIVLRNTPEIDAGSDQVLTSNVGDNANLVEILRWHIGVLEGQHEATPLYRYEPELERWIQLDTGACVHWGGSDEYAFSFDLRPDMARFIIVRNTDRCMLARGTIEHRGGTSTALFDAPLTRDEALAADEVLAAAAHMVADFDRVRVALKR